MSWIEVNFGLVRYSPVEGTHYFYDPAYPTAIQFLLSGRWEPWDVGYVRAHARDPDIKKIAQDAEARLASNPSSGYRAWPPESPGHAGHAGPIANGHHVPSQPSGSAISAPPASEPPPAFSGSDLIPALSESPEPTPSPQARGLAPPVQAPPRCSPYAAQPTPATAGPVDSLLIPALSPEVPPVNHVHQSPYPPITAPEEPALPSPDSPAPEANLVMTRETKVLLSLDGDGIRGLSTILLVESLINAICTKIGRRVDPFQIFDLIGGTSTGGTLAIMLGRLRMRPHRARDAYVDLVKTMYVDKVGFFMSLDPHAPPIPNDSKDLEGKAKTLVGHELGDPNDFFFDQRRDSTNVFVISTQTEIGVNRPALIRSYPTRRMAGPELDPDLTIWEAIKACIAAPRYIDPQGQTFRRAVIEPGLVDYGTLKNNPIRDLFYECRKLYSYANDTMIVVSIGTGIGLDRMVESNEMANSVEDRQGEAQMAGDKFENDMRDLIGNGWLKYFRFNVPDLEDVRLEEWKEVENLKAKTSAYLSQEDVRIRFYACVNAIADLLMAEQGAWETAHEPNANFVFPPRAGGR
ncbi:acyl transferase/acyl hydrolase/lysophospholipase [Clohesyomyces aquaticus]|uniref:Acyl transferase/acyl hydrolase/lysophospholipase n=1 Tax=Clohesyomyces aquaticus TaxID=1231657 RepID=A0A1Y1YIU9_9PLEO|nr:acyl transferase/acyl hydrolase/lysophospholipase [Clohesyomyces aquaticus]